MPVPILKQGKYLIVSVQAALSDAELLELRDDLVARVGTHRSQGVVLDVTALDVLDSFATRTLQVMAQMAKLRGAATIVVGIQPEVAFAMVEMGLTLEGVAEALDLEDGLALLDWITTSKDRHAG
jgi:rsbT antagonist protein RsbS